MAEIKRAKKSQTYEILELWLKTSMYSNSFIEQDFWETHYDYIKEKYINGNDIFVYTENDKIIGFTCVSSDNMINGLFVDLDYQSKGIGTELINFLKQEYSLLHVQIYAKNRKALAFSTRMGFVIDGAIRHAQNYEPMYTMLWQQ